LLQPLHLTVNIAPPSGSVKHEHPDHNKSGASKRRDHHTNPHSDIASPESDDDANEGDVDAMDDGPCDEATKAFPKFPAFDEALHALDETTVSLAKKL
jgi:hypothetical protein